MSEVPTESSSADLYEGAYGVTLRLGVPSERHLIDLKETLGGLAHGKSAQLTLENEGRFSLTGAISVRLVLSSDKERSKTVFVERRDTSRRVAWKATSGQWRTCVELLDGFRVGKPGHQYLSKEGIDDALIEVAYLGG